MRPCASRVLCHTVANSWAWSEMKEALLPMNSPLLKVFSFLHFQIHHVAVAKVMFQGVSLWILVWSFMFVDSQSRGCKVKKRLWCCCGMIPLQVRCAVGQSLSTWMIDSSLSPQLRQQGFCPNFRLHLSLLVISFPLWQSHWWAWFWERVRITTSYDGIVFKR